MRMKLDSCFEGHLLCSGGLIRWTGKLEEISHCMFVNVLAALEIAFKLSPGTQKRNFTYVPKKAETVFKNTSMPLHWPFPK